MLSHSYNKTVIKVKRIVVESLELNYKIYSIIQMCSRIYNSKWVIVMEILSKELKWIDLIHHYLKIISEIHTC
jgi:hypothetical protein